MNRVQKNLTFAAMTVLLAAPYSLAPRALAETASAAPAAKALLRATRPLLNRAIARRPLLVAPAWPVLRQRSRRTPRRQQQQDAGHGRRCIGATATTQPAANGVLTVHACRRLRVAQPWALAL